MKIKLDDDTIATLKLADGEKERVWWDDSLTGYGIALRRHKRSGEVRRKFFLQCRLSGGKQRKFPIKKKTAKAARAAAISLIGKINDGIDPGEARDVERKQSKLTFAKAVAEYLPLKQVRLSSKRHSELYLQTGPYFAAMHKTPLIKIARSDVSSALNKIIVNNGPRAAFQARRHLNTFMTWCVAMGHIDANPVVGSVKPPAGEARERVLSDDELARILRACGDDDFGRIVKLLTYRAFLVGTRSRQGLAEAAGRAREERARTRAAAGARCARHHQRDSAH
jgi:hypothetical protein